MFCIPIISLVLTSSVLVLFPLEGPVVEAYATPDLGYVWDFDDLVNNSSGAVQGPIGGPYLLQEDIIVGKNDTLISRPGTQVFVNGSHIIEVWGHFFSNGTLTDRVLFTSNLTSPQASDWFGILLQGGNAFVQYTTIEYTTYAFFVQGGTLSMSNSIVRFSHPYGIYFDGGSLTLSTVSILGTTPPPSAIIKKGSIGVFGTGNLTGEFLIEGSIIYGGNGISGGDGGEALFLSHLLGPVQILNNTILSAGDGGNNTVDGGLAGSGGYAIYTSPVPNYLSPAGITIVGNGDIIGGKGGGNSASLGGSSGNGGIAIAVMDDDRLGAIRIEENSMIMGGDGGVNSADSGVFGFYVGQGGDGIYLEHLGANETIIEGNSRVNGGRGGMNAGNSTVTCNAGTGGNGIFIFEVEGTRILTTNFTGGGGGVNIGRNCSGGQGGSGVLLYDSQFLSFVSINSSGGKGGSDFAPTLISVGGSPGDGGFGFYSSNATSYLVNSSIFGGPGGDNNWDSGSGGRGGAGVYTRMRNGTSISGGRVVGGVGGDNYDETGISGGRGWPALVIDQVDNANYSGVSLIGGKGGDSYASVAALGGRGSEAVWVFASTNIDIHDSPFINVGEGGIDWVMGNNGLRGSVAIDVDNKSRDIKIRSNFVNKSTSGIFTRSLSLIEGNLIENSSNLGIYLLSGADGTRIVNNTILAGFQYAIQCLDVSGVSITENLLDGGNGGIVIQRSNVVIDRTQIGNMTIFGVHAEQSSGFLIRNSTLSNVSARDFELLSWSNGTTVNTTFDSSKLGISGGTNLTVKNYLHVRVLDSLLAPLPNADVNVSDNGLPVYLTPGYGGANATTDVNGEVNWIVVTDRIYVGSNIATENNTDAEVTFIPKSFLNNPRSVNMATSHREIFIEFGADNLPPEIHDVLLNGLKFVDVFPGTFVDVTATLNDTMTGNSNITLANYTIGQDNWPTSTLMNPVNPPFNDNPFEEVMQTIDTSGWLPGSYKIWVYGCDSSGNCNVTGDFATLNITALDVLPP
ncbi:MAG: right-handed parallel beta-helix repeat-containing protein, partial [Thermoplasmata archaeon]